MRPGRLRHRVTLQSYSAVQNAYGEESKTYADIDTVWASIEPLRGKEYLEAQQTSAEVEVRIRLRYSTAAAAMEPKYRVVFGSRVFDVVSVINNMERNREIELMCKEYI